MYDKFSIEDKKMLDEVIDLLNIIGFKLDMTSTDNDYIFYYKHYTFKIYIIDTLNGNSYTCSLYQTVWGAKAFEDMVFYYDSSFSSSHPINQPSKKAHLAQSKITPIDVLNMFFKEIIRDNKIESII